MLLLLSSNRSFYLNKIQVEVIVTWRERHVGNLDTVLLIWQTITLAQRKFKSIDRQASVVICHGAIVYADSIEAMIWTLGTAIITP